MDSLGMTYTLQSNASLQMFPNNNAANFIVQLPMEMNLSDDYAVAIMEINYSLAFKGVREKFNNEATRKERSPLLTPLVEAYALNKAEQESKQKSIQFVNIPVSEISEELKEREEGMRLPDRRPGERPFIMADPTFENRGLIALNVANGVKQTYVASSYYKLVKREVERADRAAAQAREEAQQAQREAILEIADAEDIRAAADSALDEVERRSEEVERKSHDVERRNIEYNAREAEDENKRIAVQDEFRDKVRDLTEKYEDEIKEAEQICNEKIENEQGKTRACKRKREHDEEQYEDLIRVQRNAIANAFTTLDEEKRNTDFWRSSYISLTQEMLGNTMNHNNEDIPRYLYVYCDIVKKRCLGDTYAHFLHVVRVPPIRISGDTALDRINNPMYNRLARHNFNQIEIALRDERGRKVEYERGAIVIVTLHFKKIH